MTFNIKKFVSGFNILDGEKLGKIIFYGILIVVGLAIYHQITRPTTMVRVEKGGKSTIIQNKEKNWGIGANIQNDKTIGVSVMYFF
jgi:hypothetical protein